MEPRHELWPESITIPAVRSTTPGYAFPPIEARALAAAAAGFPPPPVDETTLVPDHRRAGRGTWRIVVPARVSAGPSTGQLLEALRPLAIHRGALEPLVYHPVGNSAHAAEAAGQWADRYERSIRETTFFLVVGDPADVPLEVSNRLATGKPVGRLFFPEGGQAAYARYAEKVMRAEAGAAAAERAEARPMAAAHLLTFATDHDDATRYSRLLTESLADEVARTWPGITTTELVGADATRDRLLDALRDGGSTPPCLLFAACHGVEGNGATDSAWGALSDQDGATLTARHIRAMEAPLLPRGIAILFWCNSGGTPGVRGWTRVLSRSALETGQDRLAAIPAALLERPDGPLAIIAHLDVLFMWGLKDTSGHDASSARSPGMAPFLQLVLSLIAGTPAGVAMQCLRRAAHGFGDLVAWTLQQRLRQGAPDPATQDRLVLDWIRWHDARGWVVMGDPLVSLGGRTAEPSWDEAYRST